MSSFLWEIQENINPLRGKGAFSTLLKLITDNFIVQSDQCLPDDGLMSTLLTPLTGEGAF